MMTLLNKTGGFVRGRMEVIVSHTPATKSQLGQPSPNRIVKSVLTFGAKPTRGQIKALTKALLSNSLPVLHYRAKYESAIDPDYILGNVLSLNFKKNTNELVVELFDVEGRVPSWPSFQFAYTLSGKPVVVII